MFVAGTACGQVVTQVFLKTLSHTPDLLLEWECDLDRAGFENPDAGGAVDGGGAVAYRAEVGKEGRG